MTGGRGSGYIIKLFERHLLPMKISKTDEVVAFLALSVKIMKGRAV